MTALAPTLQAFFTDRLVGQRDASPNTIAAYRVSLRLLLRYASQRTGKPPCELDIDDLDAPLIAAFLEHLERDRHNTARTRNNRLAAIHSLFAYAALQHPEHAASISRVLAIPPKRTERNLVTYLTDPEVDALIGACDLSTWTGRRDHAMLVLTIQTGLRISELAAPHLRRHHAHHRSHRSLRRKGPQGKTNTAGPADQDSATSLARRTPRRTDRATIPDHHRQASQP